jgi:uncharacterized protein (DUF924 family)
MGRSAMRAGFSVFDPSGGSQTFHLPSSPLPRRIGQMAEISAPQDWPVCVLAYWFDELTPKAWFDKSDAVDDTIRRRFRPTYDLVAAAPPETLVVDAATSLAAVIVLDQFPRNMFRGTARAFATDAKALSIAERAIMLAHDATTEVGRRLFYYLPFEHAEDAELQARSVALISRLGDPELERYAIAHKAIIDRFGRFPHRNVVLGRSSTEEEVQFLSQPMSSF